MSLPIHVIINNVVPFLDPKDQWSLAQSCKEMRKEFFLKYTSFTNTWRLDTRIDRHLECIEKILKKYKQHASLSFFCLRSSNTFTLRWDYIHTLYLNEYKKGKYIHPHYFGTVEEGRDFFKTQILPQFKTSHSPKVLYKNNYVSQKASKVFVEAVDALLNVIENNV